MSDVSTEVQECRRCLYTSMHPLGITFNEEGVCSGCLIHEEKDTLDWDKRFELLKRIIEPYKKANNQYDCIVPITGANDSYFIVHIVKNILKLDMLFQRQVVQVLCI